MLVDEKLIRRVSQGIDSLRPLQPMEAMKDGAGNSLPSLSIIWSVLKYKGG